MAYKSMQRSGSETFRCLLHFWRFAGSSEHEAKAMTWRLDAKKNDTVACVYLSNIFCIEWCTCIGKHFVGRCTSREAYLALQLFFVVREACILGGGERHGCNAWQQVRYVCMFAINGILENVIIRRRYLWRASCGEITWTYDSTSPCHVERSLLNACSDHPCILSFLLANFELRSLQTYSLYNHNNVIRQHTRSKRRRSSNQELRRWPHVPGRLRTVWLQPIDFLQDDTIDDELNVMVDALTDNPNLAIEEFVLSYPQYKVGEQGVIALAVLFLQNTTIKSFVLDNVRFVGPYGLQALFGALKYNRTVTYLALASDDEPFDPFGGPDNDKTILSQNCIVELPNVFRENPVLERVCLRPNGLTDQDVINHLAPALALNESIIELDVSSNSGITEVGLFALREAMGDRGVVIADDNCDGASE